MQPGRAYAGGYPDPTRPAAGATHRPGARCPASPSPEKRAARPGRRPHPLPNGTYAVSPAGNDTSPESFLLHNALARKPKRIRTAFSPSQLLRLEHAFEKNHYVVGAERKQLAHSLSLTETQVSGAQARRPPTPISGPTQLAHKCRAQRGPSPKGPGLGSTPPTQDVDVSRCQAALVSRWDRRSLPAPGAGERGGGRAAWMAPSGRWT